MTFPESRAPGPESLSSLPQRVEQDIERDLRRIFAGVAGELKRLERFEGALRSAAMLRAAISSIGERCVDAADLGAGSTATDVSLSSALASSASASSTSRSKFVKFSCC